jgi:hypothetical protein
MFIFNVHFQCSFSMFIFNVHFQCSFSMFIGQRKHDVTMSTNARLLIGRSDPKNNVNNVPRNTYMVSVKAQISPGKWEIKRLLDNWMDGRGRLLVSRGSSTSVESAGQPLRTLAVDNNITTLIHKLLKNSAIAFDKLLRQLKFQIRRIFSANHPISLPSEV